MANEYTQFNMALFKKMNRALPEKQYNLRNKQQTSVMAILKC